MNGKTGKFTAPRNGVYFFAFNGIAVITAAEGGMNVALMVNGNPVGTAQCKSHAGNEWENLALQSTIELKAGDQVWLQITSISTGVILYQVPAFTGWLLQENLSRSL